MFEKKYKEWTGTREDLVKVLKQIEDKKIILNQFGRQTIYNIETMTIKGHTSPLVEDLRDYLRRRGIKIFTRDSFNSIKPNWKK